MELTLKMSHEAVETICTPSRSTAIQHKSVPCEAAAAALSKNESYWNSWAARQEKVLHCCSFEVYIEISSSSIKCEHSFPQSHYFQVLNRHMPAAVLLDRAGTKFLWAAQL